jgi:hypothetical protein
MALVVSSFPSRLGSISFYPIGFSWENKEVARLISCAYDFLGEYREKLEEDDAEEKNFERALKYIQEVVASMKKAKKANYVAVKEGEVFVFYDETLGLAEMFAPSLIQFIEAGDTKMFCSDCNFESIALVLRAEKSIYTVKKSKNK